MKTTSNLLIPQAVSEYISQHFREDFLTQISSGKDADGKNYYAIDVSQDETIYHLKFNERGALIKQELEPLLELDDEEPGFTED